MKKIISIGTIIILITTIFNGCSKENKKNDESNTTATAFGIIAEVIEVFDGYCRAKVTNEDTNFSKDTNVLIYFNKIYQELNEVADDAKDTKKTEEIDKLNVGDKISVTYTEYQKDDNEYSINAPYIEIIQ
ncbi:hypothetical protein R2R35_18205 [Anaerocolumna sp. AGMB13020]|uniref:hypothetical protein n=1 Tax=Anaerocolumna sp. AGMB13020 TaxID=3081750 RepID=UPI002953886B|nr:hypothetical protein [Anaerocolumna sp. AGMB13020]WOO35716.1 hypothetical protein R2R35_18205 [Anaerocolumna sp. AGMB13020]